MDPRTRPMQKQARRTAMVIAGVYLVFAVAWIIFSDRAVVIITAAHAQSVLLQTIKGIAFVCVSAALIYFLVLTALRRQGVLEAERARTEHRLAEVLDAVNDGVWEHDVATGVVRWAGRWTALTGYAADAMGTADRFPELIHADDRADVIALYGAFVDGTAPTFEADYRLCAADGTWLWVRARGRVVERAADGLPSLTMGAFTDLTAVKQGEERLASLVDSLRRSEAEIERFGHATVHELREPVRQMVSYAQLLARDIDPTGGSADYVRFLREGGARMTALLDGLQASFEHRAQTAVFKPVDLDRVVRQVLGKLGGDLTRAGCRAELGPLPTVLGDDIQLALLFEHLVGNVLKFRRPDAPPCIAIGAEQVGDTWAIRVEDNGIGFPSDQAERMFDALVRLHAPAVYPGCGMGLSLCRSIVRHHGGTIAAHGVEEQGAVFTITLPMAEANTVPGAWPVAAEVVERR